MKRAPGLDKTNLKHLISM